MNKAANLQVGDGLFTNVIFETDRGAIEKVVISTDRTTTIKGTDGKDIVIPDSGGIEKLADELVF